MLAYTLQMKMQVTKAEHSNWLNRHLREAVLI